MQTSSSQFETRAVHGGMAGVRASGSHVPVIDFSTTNPLGSVETGGLSYEELATGHDLGEGRSAVYQRLWQPGVARFEESLAGLEGTEGAVAFASGMAALAATLIATASAGKPHVVAVRPLYGGTDHVLEGGLLGTRVTWTDAAGIAAAIEPDTGLVVVETPANPTLELARPATGGGCRGRRAACSSTTPSPPPCCSVRPSSAPRSCCTAPRSTSADTAT